MISLCIIVKNEQDNIKECLKRASGFVDEIILVDTGSTDDTKGIASEFTDIIYDYKWNGDFAAARNFSISKASNDWILVLDADEYISRFSGEKIRDFIDNVRNEKIVGRIERTNLLEDSTGERKYTERISRLFNKKHYHYEGKIHEQIVSYNFTGYRTIPVDIVVFHEGYTKGALNKTNKLSRNKNMLIKAINNNPDDPYLNYQLGKTFFMLKEYDKSCFYFDKSLTFNIDLRLEYAEDLVETYGYALINSGRYSDAIRIKNYVKFYEKSADFNFLMGLIYMNNAEFKKAVDSFLICTKLTNGRMEGITTFLPYYNIGVIYEVLGFKNKASEYYLLCGEYRQAMERLKQMSKL